MLRDTGIEPVTSSVSGKRSPAELNALIVFFKAIHTSGGLGADDETRTRDPHLGKVMRYQLRYIRGASVGLPQVFLRRLCARYWDRTSDPYRVEVVLYR